MKKYYSYKIIILLLIFIPAFGYAQEEGDGQIQEETFNKVESEQEIAKEAYIDPEVDPEEEFIETETKTFELRNIPVEKVVGEVGKILTEEIGKVQLDSNANHLVVTDIPEKIQEITELVEKMDKEEKEVRIKVKALQIVLNDEHLMGVDWEAIVSNYQKVSASKNMSEKGFKKSSNNINNSPLSVGTVSNEDLLVLQEALDTVGEINVITDSKTKMKNNQRSKIVIGPAFSIIVNEEEREEIGNVALKNQLIILSLSPKIEEGKSLLKTHIVSEIGYPAQIFDVAVNVEESSTMVLGGIFKEVLVPSTRKIPLLGDIPFLGFAFRNQGQRKRLSEIIIFVTPKVEK